MLPILPQRTTTQYSIRSSKTITDNDFIVNRKLRLQNCCGENSQIYREMKKKNDNA